MLRYPQIQCPYCGAGQTLILDCSSEVQDFYQDCCCCDRAMAILVTCSYEGELLSLEVNVAPEISRC